MMCLWRKVLNISWSDKVYNEEALRQVSEERAVISVTNKRHSALSIQPKIPEISVGTSNGMDHFSLVQLEYSGPALKVIHFDWSGYLCRSVGLKCPVPFDKLVVPSTLFCILLTRTITKHAVAWVGSVQPECTIPLGTWNFRNFKPEHELNGKCPESLAWSYPTT